MKLITAQTKEAYQLLHRGAAALADVEANGIRIDVPYLDEQLKLAAASIAEQERALKGTKFYKDWDKVYGDKANLDAPEQLAHILFNLMKFPITQRTKSENPKSNESHLRTVDHPFVEPYLTLRKWNKLHGTYLLGIKRELVGEFIHPSFNLNRVKSYRLSCSDPNFQNFPIRTPWMGKIIRTCIIPREGQQLVEVDYSTIEVKVAACFNHDPQLIKYMSDRGTDMHRDTAARIWGCSHAQVSKEARYYTKNQFVFPQFYGSYYLDCAKALWGSMQNKELRLRLPTDGKEATGALLQDHLVKQGIKALGLCDPDKKPRAGTFEAHVKAIEDWFWNERFPVYTRWKKQWYNDYLRKGYFHSLVGFCYQGVYKRNEVLNIAVQGDASHCLLESTIRLNTWLRKNKMRTKMCGIIHDSIVADSPPEERDDYVEQALEVMIADVPRAWDWLIVPLDCEVEVAAVDQSWYAKEKIQA